MNVKNLKNILIILLFISIAIISINLFIQKNIVKEQIQNEEILNPKDVIQKYIDIIINGGGTVPSSIDSNNDANQFLASTKYKGDDRIFMGRYFTVINKYEIVSESQPTDKNTYYVKVNFYCEKIISGEPTGLKSEKGILASNLSGGEPTFSINDCLEFHKEIYNDCLDNNQPINENAYSHTYDCKNNIEIINFELVKENNLWKINPHGSSDHVSIDTYNKWLKMLDSSNVENK